jgi:hypothetical protein
MPGRGLTGRSQGAGRPRPGRLLACPRPPLRDRRYRGTARRYRRRPGAGLAAGHLVRHDRCRRGARRGPRARHGWGDGTGSDHGNLAAVRQLTARIADVGAARSEPVLVRLVGATVDAVRTQAAGRQATWSSGASPRVSTWTATWLGRGRRHPSTRRSQRSPCSARTCERTRRSALASTTPPRTPRWCGPVGPVRS